MLAIRLQRTGRKGHAQYRLVVQDSRFTPTSGRVVAYVGNYNPHTKQSKLDIEKINNYLKNGAQPSGRAIKLLETNKVELPAWVEKLSEKKRDIRNPEKRRSTAPEAPAEPEAAAEPAEEAESTESTAAEPAAEQPQEESSAEAPAEPEQAEPAAESAPEAEKPAEPAADEPTPAAEEPKSEEPS